MANILIATLGKSPAVVTAMVKKLCEDENIPIHQVYVIYPEDAALVDQAYDLIHTTLKSYDSEIDVQPMIFPGNDANSAESTFQFLKVATFLLEQVGAFLEDDDNIYISIAGGRKNMSASMLFPCQFAQSIQKVFHLIDRQEGTPREQIIPFVRLNCLPAAARRKKMFPPLKDLILVDVEFSRQPYPQQFLEFIKRPARDAAIVAQFESGYVSSETDPGWLPVAEGLFRDTPSDDPLAFLRPKDSTPEHGTLIMPLGESPAVVYQTYALLERQGKLIDKVVVIYPEGHQSIRMGVRWLRGGFDKRKIPFCDHSINKMKDCRTREECQQFREALETLIQEECRQSPETPIWLSVSGGRKTMALYALLAAQEQKIPHVYHTLITDPDLEDILIEEGTFQILIRKRADELEAFLFRDDLNLDQFELFRIPLIFSKKL